MKPLLLALLLLATGPAFAQGVPGEPPFAEHRLVLQLSDAGDAKQSQVLGNAENVLAAYGQDKVAIEVVAFGPGVDLLRDGNAHADLIHSLSLQGVTFDVCLNTVQTIERTTGRPYPLNPLAHRVQAGIVQIMTLAEHGYVVVRP